jgi:hypothetical protein
VHRRGRRGSRHAGLALGLGAAEKRAGVNGDSGARPSSSAASLRVGDCVLRKAERSHWLACVKEKRERRGAWLDQD